MCEIGRIAFSCGGRRAAVKIALLPPQESPIIPISPVHQGCAASHSSTWMLSSLARRDLHHPLLQSHGIAGAAHVDAKAGIAMRREVAVDRRIAKRPLVALAVGNRLDDPRHGLGISFCRPPELGGELTAVLHLDDLAVDLDHVAAENRHDPHAPRHFRLSAAMPAVRSIGGPAIGRQTLFWIT